MNYSLDQLPYSGENPVVYMDISLNGQKLGRICIRLYRGAFPAGVENFVKIATGNTCRICKPSEPKYRYIKHIKRSFDNTNFFNHSYNNYIVGGDIYNNDGSSAGTVYNDEPIPEPEIFLRTHHDAKGLVSLVPFKDEATDKIFYDSTFMITLYDRPTEMMDELDKDQIVIGKIYSGIELLDKMNQLLVPFAGKKYPKFKIEKSGILNSQIKRRN